MDVSRLSNVTMYVVVQMMNKAHDDWVTGLVLIPGSNHLLSGVLVFQVTFLQVTARNSVCPSVCLSVTRRYCVKTTARSTVQFALVDSKMCLVL